MFSFRRRREVRQKLQGVLHNLHARCYIAIVVASSYAFCGQDVGAQGLVGTPVDCRFGSYCGADYSPIVCYDDVHLLLAQIFTIMAAIVAVVLAILRCRSSRGKKLAIELIAIVLVPVSAHLGGIYFVNSLSGLGSSF